jgi:hypothetical protein
VPLGAGDHADVMRLTFAFDNVGVCLELGGRADLEQLVAVQLPCDHEVDRGHQARVGEFHGVPCGGGDPAHCVDRGLDRREGSDYLRIRMIGEVEDNIHQGLKGVIEPLSLPLDRFRLPASTAS